MLKKTQKYLLLNYPLIWNTKLVPISIVIICFNILFFFLGYITTNLNINDFEYFYYRDDKEFIFYFIAVFTSLLVLIIWLIFYLKNNAFKCFYPKTSYNLYVEWLIIFFILSGNTLYVASYMQGCLYKEKSYISLQELGKTKDLLQRINAFLPKNSTNIYESNPRKNSLLGSSDNKEIKWLKEGKTDSIKSLMNLYLQLQKKHNLTIESWFNLIYQPPYFPITKENSIYKRKISTDTNNYYVEYDKLNNYYQKIDDAYSFKNSECILPCIYTALTLSILLFSFRVTSGKTWLISVVSCGILYFILGLIFIFYETVSDYKSSYFTTIFSGYWTLIFLVSSTLIGYKLFNKSTKGKSSILLNICLWLFPFLPLIQYMDYMNVYKYSGKNITSASLVYNYFYENPYIFSWINLIFVIVVFPFIMILVKRWKALPDK